MFALSWWLGANVLRQLLLQNGVDRASAATALVPQRSDRSESRPATPETSNGPLQAAMPEAASPIVATNNAMQAAADQSVLPIEVFPPLPPGDALVGAELMAMRARAEQGDARAACWLGLELTRCHELSRIQPWHDQAIGQMLDQPTDQKDEAERMDRWQQFDGLSQRCRGLSPKQMSGAGAWLVVAADAGSIPALERILLGGPSASTEYPAPELMAKTLDRQLDYLLHGVRNGSRVALDLFEQAFGDLGAISFESSVSMLSATDRAYARAYLAALQDAHRIAHPEEAGSVLPIEARRPSSNEVTLPAEMLAEIRAEAARAYAARWRHQQNEQGQAFLTEPASEVCEALGPPPKPVTGIREVLLR